MKEKFLRLLNFIKKYGVVLVLTADALVVPVLFFLRWLAGEMLSSGKGSCIWADFGLQCVTCGGTRCVNNLLNGRIYDAFLMNHLVFWGILFLIATFIFINMLVLFRSRFAGRALRKMYSIPMLVVAVAVLIVFFFGRNTDNVITLLRLYM